MVEKFDYFHIGYATAATAIKFSFFVQVISSRYSLTVFHFPDFPQPGSLPGVFSGLAEPHMIISLKSPTCPAIVDLCSVDKVASRLGQISSFAREREGIRRSGRFVDVPTCLDHARRILMQLCTWRISACTARLAAISEITSALLRARD